MSSLVTSKYTRNLITEDAQMNRCLTNVSVPLIPDSDYTNSGDDLIPISLQSEEKSGWSPC